MSFDVWIRSRKKQSLPRPLLYFRVQYLPEVYLSKIVFIKCSSSWMYVIAWCVNSNILLNWLCNSYRYVLFSKFSSPTSEDEHVANHRLEPLDEVDPTAQSITNKVSLTTFILARKIWRTFCKNGEGWNGSKRVFSPLAVIQVRPADNKASLHYHRYRVVKITKLMFYCEMRSYLFLRIRRR